MSEFNYENKDYLEKLDELPESYYSKYITFVKKYSKSNKSKFLDIGCGNGTNLKLLFKDGYVNGYGCDISKHFINTAKKGGLKRVYAYDGVNYPFKKNTFDVIGSFNVLEHVDQPEKFLNSQIKILNKEGYIIVACPNFLSVLFKNNHRRLKGFKNKIRNLGLIITKLLNPNSTFEKMPPVIRKNFEYDDDAIVVTNLIDLKKVFTKNNCNIVYESGFINFDTNLYKFINNIPLMKYLLPSCFIVVQKK